MDDQSCLPCLPGTASAVLGASSASTCRPCRALESSTLGAVECWPGVRFANASNPPPLVKGYSVGDVVTVAFTSATNTPDVLGEGMVQFTPSIGGVVASWRDGGQTLLVRVVDTTGVLPTAVRGGVLCFLRGRVSRGRADSATARA